MSQTNPDMYTFRCNTDDLARFKLLTQGGVTPHKVATANVLRAFVKAYIANPAYMSQQLKPYM